MRIGRKEKTYSAADNKLLYKRSGMAKAVYAVVFVIFVVYVLSLLLPFLWVFLSSFKGDMEFADLNNSAFSLPKTWHFENWKLCFEVLEVEGTSFFGMLWNSIWYVGVGALLGVFFEVATAYIVTKYNHFKISRIMYVLVIFFLTFPVMGQTGARYKVLHEVGLADTPFYVILFAMTGFTTSFLIFCSSWEGVSNTYSEAAKIDGAGHFRIFFTVMLPMLKGPIFSVMILAFIGRWNMYANIMLYLPSYPTLATGLYLFQSVTDRMANIPVYFCGIFISVLPPLILFCLFSETIMKNVTQGGIKG